MQHPFAGILPAQLNLDLLPETDLEDVVGGLSKNLAENGGGKGSGGGSGGGGVTTTAVGEEGSGRPTTLMVGEEGGRGGTGS